MEKILRSLARWVWEIQGEAYTTRYRDTGLVINEETITEMLLLKCIRLARGRQPGGGQRRRIPSFGVARFLSGRGRPPFAAFDVKMFSKRKEGGNGADWEWLFKFGDCEFGFRVQAKRLYKDSEYDGFGDNNNQNRNLIAEAQKDGLIPIYVFYNHSFGRESHLFAGGSFIGRYSRRRSDWGCSVAHAECVRDVHANMGRRGRVSDIFPYMLPWHELLELALFLMWGGEISRRYSFYLYRYLMRRFGNSTRYFFNLIKYFYYPESFSVNKCPLEWILKNYGLNELNGEDLYEKHGKDLYEKHGKFFEKYIEHLYKKAHPSDEDSENKLNIDSILAQIDNKEKMSSYVKERNLRGVAVFTLPGPCAPPPDSQHAQ